MSERRDIVEWLNVRFERLGVWSYDHRALVLAGCAVLLGLSLWGASGVRFDNSFEAYFDTEDDSYIAYNRYRDDFGSDEISYIVYEAPDRAEGPFDLEVMRRVAQLTEAIEDEVPFV
jgi:predicted RND superfamily exporter protein